MTFGTGAYTYEVITNWAKLPAGWQWGVIPAVACDSGDRIYVFSRSDHPLVIFDKDGNFLASWGEGLFGSAHGIYIDPDDNVYCTDVKKHCVFKFSSSGRLLATFGTVGLPAPRPGDPFNGPTDTAVAAGGELFVSDGYGNARIHKFAPDGKLLLSWGEPGDGPGQFHLPHCVRVDKYGRVWVCDRENNRIQIFDTNGTLLDTWTGLLRPTALHFDPHNDVVYIPQLTQQLGIFTLEGELLAQWGGAQPSDRPGEFLGGPHGVCTDSEGSLYVAEALVPGRIQKFVPRPDC